MNTEALTDIIVGSDVLGSKRTNLQMAAAFFLAVVLAGCSEKNDTPQATASGQNRASAQSDKVVIEGSNTVGEELTPKLISEYKKDHADAKFDLESKGTGTGFSGLVADVCNIAAASRPIDPGEQDLAKSRGVEMNEH